MIALSIRLPIRPTLFAHPHQVMFQEKGRQELGLAFIFAHLFDHMFGQSALQLCSSFPLRAHVVT